MKLHLDYIPAKPGFSVSHSDSIFLAGSCFSENIGNLLQQHKFNALSNPNGILFNPLSIATSLDNIINIEAADEKLFVERDGNYFSFLHHSSINAVSKKELANKIDSQNENSLEFLKHVTQIIITFGTAYYYHHKTLDKPVANCHKQPQQVFEKKLLSVKEITTVYDKLLAQIHAINPNIRVIFTVSPVKYLKDGVIENNLSKSVLLLAVHELVKQRNNSFYFPAFELVNDDLRDYRFYKEDMAHPNEQAINYVWDKFSDCFFSEATKDLNKHIHKLNLALQHTQLHQSQQEKGKLDDFIAKQKAEIHKLNPAIVF